ncbi:MAG: hypothetical protein HW387_531 [Parachlamydiales bacterium]|nr:hypothetical protein [Parachlamydiales bacterium]
MSVTVKNIVGGCPQFQNEMPITGRSLLAENRSITHLKPTDQSNNKMILCILRIWQRILNWLIPFAKTNYVGIVAALDRNSETAVLGQMEMISYFQRFFKSDGASSPDVVQCVEHLQEQYIAIEAFQKESESVRGETEENMNKRFAKPKKLLDQWIKNVLQLKEGQQSLIAANTAAGDELFYLFSKKNDKISLKIIGRGASIVRLSGIEEVAVAGQAKIPACLNFGEMQEELIRDLFAHSPLGKRSTNVSLLEDVLKDRLVEEEDCLASLETKTGDVFNAFWMALKGVEKNAGKTDGDIRRTKLRLEIFTLFTLLKEYRFSLSKSPSEVQTLGRMFNICSQNLAKAHLEGVVSESEIGELIKELTQVQKAIDAACSSRQTPISYLKMASMDLYPLKKLAALRAPVAVAIPENKTIAHPRDPSLAPPSASGEGRSAPLVRKPAISGLAMPIPDRLRSLAAGSTLQQIVRAIYEIEFFPYKKGDIHSDDAAPDANSPWVQFTLSAAKEIMENLNILSKRLVDSFVQEKELPIDMYEVLIKMTYMTAFLTHHTINQGVFSPETYILTAKILDFGGKVSGGSHSDMNRSGHCIHPANVSTIEQLRDFYWKFSLLKGIDREALRTSVNLMEKSGNLMEKIEGLISLQMQVDFLTHLTPSHPGREDELGCLLPSMLGWIAPLPLPLLAIYHIMKMVVGVNKPRHITRVWRWSGRIYAFGTHWIGPTNRNTPEAVQHDPESIFREYEQTIMEEVTTWRYRVEAEFGDPINFKTMSRFGRCYLREFDEVRLRESPYAGEVRKQQIKTLLKKQEDYLLRANQMEIHFSKEELTALLSLLRSERPQMEVIAFMKAHAPMLSHPVVRSFIQLIFFDISLLNTLNHASNSVMMPRFLAEKIVEYREKAKKKPEEMTTLLFFMQMSERLKGIYEVLKKDIDPAERCKYETSSFFDISNPEIQSFLTAQRKKDPASEASIEMIALQLKILLAKPQLSQDELCRIILDMQHLLESAHHTSSIDTRELFWIKGSYQELMRQIPNVLDNEHLNYVLDAICRRKGLLLDHSPWSGNFPRFANALYMVDIETGTVKDLATESITTTLPGDLVAKPSFRKNFPDLIGKDVLAMVYQDERGAKIYTFEDLQKNPCRVEERGGVYALYRSFPNAGHPELLQAGDITNGHVDEESLDAILQNREGKSENGMPGFFDTVKRILQIRKKEHILPAILQKRLFIDPKDPLIGYIFNSVGEMELELAFEKTRAGLKISGVIDLREGKRSEPMQLVGLSEVNHPALQQLEQIEDPAHILVWGKKGFVEKIELPRYGLQFTLKEGSLVCANPQYAGYKVLLSASIAKRKGFAFSLLLDNPDRTRPKKLILPPASAIVSGMAPQPPYFGLASGIWAAKMIFAFLFNRSMPPMFASPFFHIEAMGESLKPVIVDLRPHTDEFLFAPGQEIEQSQEMISQAIKLGDDERAFEVVRLLDIEREDKAILKWIRFLSQFEEEGHAAAVGLKIAEKLYEKIYGQKKYEEMCEKLNAVEGKLFKAYLKAVKNLTAPLQTNRETFERMAEYLKKEDPLYYQKHITPYFLKIGERFTLPVTRLNGQMTPLPQILEAADRERRKQLTAIRKLELEVSPERSIDRNSLSRELSLLSDPRPLLFDRDVLVGKYFDPASTELIKGDELLKVVRSKRQELEKEKAQVKDALQKLLSRSSDALDQLAIFAKEKRAAQISDLLMALLQHDFESLQREDRLPKGVDLQKLKETAIHFFDLEVRLHLSTRCEAELSQIVLEKGQTAALLDPLCYGRQYKIDEYPELLAFEAFHFVVFRNSNHPSQIELLQQLIKSPAGIVQAGTGTGKSSVLCVLRALMRANGTNLVTQKVLPHLYQETLAILQGRLGQTFKKKVYPFLFNQSMPLYDKEGNSLFERIYHNLLETIKTKGCVLTDYKSFVLLEQKFFTLSKQISGHRDSGIESPPILMKHWLYLAKILLLFKNREDQLMDEFDGPLSAVQRIQTQMAEGPKFSGWMIDESLALYDLLLEEKSLRLEQNLQGDLPEKTRQECIERVAMKLADLRARGSATPQLIYSYLIGENEAVLPHIEAWSFLEKDALAFLKDQCTTYLPLTLNRSSVSNYARSKDGAKIITCSKGERRDAKFGNPVEEINYTIQDYFQQKIALPTLRDWIALAKKDWSADSKAAQERFSDVLPGISLTQLAYLKPDEFEDRVEALLVDANKNPAAVRFFLRRHLESLRSSGIVISMNPQDSVGMSCAVSGVSATTGSLGSLHEQFQRDLSVAETVQQEMLARLRGRSHGAPIHYNPLDPLAVLGQMRDPKLCALIDGNGAFRSIPPQEVAKVLMAANPLLERVDYYDREGNISSVGDPEAALAQKGFYFPQAQTRGSDQVLRPDGLFLMTASEKGGIEDFIQEEGRARHPQQRVLVALSEYASPALKTVDDLIVHKKENEKAVNEEDRYRAELQRMRQMMRDAARRELLHTPDLNKLQMFWEDPNIAPSRILDEMRPFLDRFKQCESLFITSSSEEGNPGAYFNKHRHLVKRIFDPIQQLREFQNFLADECRRIGIVAGELAENDVEALRFHMPKRVLPLSAAEDQQQEVQEELELNNMVEQETEEERQTEQQVQQSKVGFYLPRLPTNGVTIPLSQLHAAFSPKLFFTDPYLPLQRKDPLHKRKPFDDRTTRVGSVTVDLTSTHRDIARILVEDPLDEVDRDSYRYDRERNSSFRYDIRTGKASMMLSSVDDLLNNPEFNSLIAQIKFLDGMTDGYTTDELAGLRTWLQQNGVDEMQRFFNKTVLLNRPEHRFPHSQLWNLFKEIGSLYYTVV